MNNCTHNASQLLATGGGFAISQCQQGCEKVFVSYHDSNKNIHDMTRDEIEALRAERDAAILHLKNILAIHPPLTGERAKAAERWLVELGGG